MIKADIVMILLCVGVVILAVYMIPTIPTLTSETKQRDDKMNLKKIFKQASRLKSDRRKSAAALQLTASFKRLKKYYNEGDMDNFFFFADGLYLDVEHLNKTQLESFEEDFKWLQKTMNDIEKNNQHIRRIK